MSFNWTKLPHQMNIQTNKYCKQKVRIYNLHTIITGYYDIRVECHSFKMLLNYYYIEKVIPHLRRPSNRLRFDFLNHHYRNSIFSCVWGSRTTIHKDSSIEAAKLCKRKGMSLPMFLSRRDQEELLYLLKTINIFPIKALFIGLHGSFGQV